MKKYAGFLLFSVFFLFCQVLFIWPQSYFSETPPIISRAAVVMDAATGTLVYYKNPDMEIPPASLTKLMTMHLLLKKVDEGKFSLDDYMYPPRQSWAVNQPPQSSLMYLANGQRLTVRELMLGLSIFSGNDAAVAAALLTAPSVEDFAKMMNEEASLLGLSKTRFVEPSGYSELNMTTAREFAEFCRFYLTTHPYSLENFHSVLTFSYPKESNVTGAFVGNYRTRTQWNRNTLVGKVEGVDGLKTGFINESGYNIALTAARNGTRFIAVILGAPSEPGGDAVRDEDGRKLINWAFDSFKTVTPPPYEFEPLRVWKGKPKFIGLAAKEPLVFTAPANRAFEIYSKIELNERLIAPIPAGSKAGEIIIYDDKGELHRITIVTDSRVEKGGFFRNIIDTIILFFNGK